MARFAAWLRKRKRIIRRAALVGGVLDFALCGAYAVLMFVQHVPEYLRTFPESKLALYWTPYDEVPDFGLFGFPYRAGWKAVGRLVETGVFVGDYESNEEPPITNYYLRTASRWHCPTPGMYVTAVNVQDEVYIRWDQVEDAYRPAALVTVEGKPKIAVHTIDAVGEAPWLPVESYESAYDLGTTPERVAGVALWYPKMPEPQTEPLTAVDLNVGSEFRLVGYHLDSTEVTAGSYVPLTLVWEALSDDVGDYAIFTHVPGNGALWGQLDGLPDCGESSTACWRPGAPVADLFRIPIRVDTPPGTYPLRVGMYNRASLERLPVSGPDGTPLGDGAYLTDIVVLSRVVHTQP